MTGVGRGNKLEEDLITLLAVRRVFYPWQQSSLANGLGWAFQKTVPAGNIQDQSSVDM